MALVSPSLSPANGLAYGATPPAFSRSSSDPPPAQIRALPTIPTGAARRQGSQQSLGGSGGSSPATQAARPLPSPAAGRSPSAPPFVELASSRSISPLPPSSTSRSTTPSRSSSTPSPSPYHQHQHTLSASSSASSSVGSLPRLPPVHLAQGPNSAPPVPNGLVGVQYSQHPPPHHQPHQHPSFVGHHQAFPSFGGGAAPHAFPHPQYPFIPSPHPHAGGVGAALGYQPGPYSPGFNAPGAQGGAGSSAVSAESQHQARLVQQAHLQQQQWQMEMMRNQQGQAFDWQQQQQQQGQARRRATSGPAPPNHSPTYYTSALPYPPSPSPTLHTKYLPNVGAPPLPPGAMLPQFGHGYPTPPGSVEGRENSREGYHPYRRGGGKADNDASQRSASHPRPPTSSAMTHNPSGSSSSSHHHQRNESSTSALAAHNFPPLPGKPSPSPVASSSSSSSASAFTGASSTKHGNSSTTSVGSSTGGRSSSARSTPPPPATVPLPPVSRTRTESQHSSTSSRDTHARQYSSSSGSSSRRGDSFDSARSATPVQGLNSKKPSPLSRQYQQAASVASHGSSSRPSSELERPGTPGTLRAGREEEEEDSDDTAGATIAPNSASALKGLGGAGVQGKEKDKKGMKSRFKKAFGGSSSTPALSETELDGRGPKVAERRRVDSSSSTDSAALAGQPRLASSSASVMTPTSSAASTSGSTRPPPSTTGRRFGMLNGKFNGSSDNLSISSTVSSASVMIRKLGNMGKIARRNSLMSLTKAFKSKDKEEDPSAPTKEELKQLKKDKKKGSLASASVSHATAEVESPSRVNGMSPAAALAKKHQQQYAEQEAAAAAAEAAAEAERQRNGRSFTVHARGESDAASVKSGKMLDKDKDKTKKSKGRKWGFGGSKKEGSTADDASSIADGSSIREGGYSRSTSAAGYYDDEGLAPGVEVLAQPAYAAYGASYQEGEVAADSIGEEDYEPSVVENTHRREYKGVRGILKGAGSYRQEDYALPKPAFPRTRASSFDAPQQQARPGSPGNAALVNVIPSEAQVDGLVPSATSPRSADTQPPSPNTTPLDRVTPPPSANPASASAGAGSTPSTSPYAHPSMNVSAPTLSQFSKLHPIRSASAPGGSGRRIAFAQNLSVHTTWPANVYDRRAEPATCNRLTPTLAQQIKEELNSFKMEEMDVHPSSRQLTHFFV